MKRLICWLRGHRSAWFLGKIAGTSITIHVCARCSDWYFTHEGVVYEQE